MLTLWSFQNITHSSSTNAGTLRRGYSIICPMAVSNVGGCGKEGGAKSRGNSGDAQ